MNGKLLDQWEDAQGEEMQEQDFCPLCGQESLIDNSNSCLCVNCNEFVR